MPDYEYDNFEEHDYEGLFDSMKMPTDDKTIEQLNLKYDDFKHEGNEDLWLFDEAEMRYG